MTEVREVLEGFMVDKEELSLEIAGPIPNKANEPPFLRMRKKIGPWSFKATNIGGGSNEEEAPAPAPNKRAPVRVEKRS